MLPSDNFVCITLPHTWDFHLDEMLLSEKLVSITLPDTQDFHLWTKCSFPKVCVYYPTRRVGFLHKDEMLLSMLFNSFQSVSPYHTFPIIPTNKIKKIVTILLMIEIFAFCEIFSKLCTKFIEIFEISSLDEMLLSDR